MTSKIAVSIILTFLLSACGTKSTNQETTKAIAEACETIKSDGAVLDITGTEKKFVALAKLDVNYLGLLDVYAKWSQEMMSPDTGRPNQYPPFPRSITLFCNE